MDRDDLKLAVVALRARVRSMAPALDVLAIEQFERLHAVAGRVRHHARSAEFELGLYAADAIDEIAEHGHRVLEKPLHAKAIEALEVLEKLLQAPVNRSGRRKDAAIRDRQARRIARSERLQAIAARHAHETKH